MFELLQKICPQVKTIIATINERWLIVAHGSSRSCAKVRVSFTIARASICPFEEIELEIIIYHAVRHRNATITQCSITISARARSRGYEAPHASVVSRISIIGISIYPRRTDGDDPIFTPWEHSYPRRARSISPPINSFPDCKLAFNEVKQLELEGTRREREETETRQFDIESLQLGIFQVTRVRASTRETNS